MFEVNSSVVIGERRYIQLIGRDNSGDISKLETFVTVIREKCPGSSFLISTVTTDDLLDKQQANTPSTLIILRQISVCKFHLHTH